MTQVDTFGTASWATTLHLLKRDIRQIFAELRRAQDRFTDIQASLDLPNYEWPLQPLYDWSRRVEYPFVTQSLRNTRGPVLDAGSGVTFFPSFISDQFGVRVDCLDINPEYPERMRRICATRNSPSPTFHIADIRGKLPFADGFYDAAISISVLEHLPPENRSAAITELWRVVTPGGRLIVTFDVDLNGGSEGLSMAEADQILELIDTTFCRMPTLPKPSRTLLTPTNPGFGILPVRYGSRIVGFEARALWYRIKGRRIPGVPPSLAVLMCTIPKAG